jgi:hypothetical protein
LLTLLLLASCGPNDAAQEVLMSSDSDSGLARLADAIIASNRAIRVATESCAENPVVAAYGLALKGALPWIIGGQTLFDAEVLPAGKQEIKSALVECAGYRSLGEEERAALSDLYFYLSYFIEGMTDREDDPNVDMFAEQRIQGQELRAEWRMAVSVKTKSSFFSTFLSRLNRDA